MKANRPTTQRRKRRAPDEATAPSAEYEAEATPSPAHSLETLRDPRAGIAERGRAALELQRAVGNAQVVRELGREHIAEPVQRYTVPADLECDQVVDWLNANSPYAPEWGETRSTFAFHGQLKMRFQDLPDGQVQVTVFGHAGLTVSVRSPVDRPRWAPSRRRKRAAEIRAWRSMRARLDAHEQKHKRIARQERAKIEQKFRTLNFSVVGATKEEARNMAIERVRAEQAQWQADAQVEQNTIDPFRDAVLACPGRATSNETGGDDQ